MTIAELRDLLKKYCDNGFGDASVLICDMRDNPLTDGTEVKDAAFIEWKDGDCMFVIQAN